MNEERKLKIVEGGAAKIRREDLVQRLHLLSGREILDLLLSHENPRALVKGMTAEDFFWMVKKVGKEDCLPLLRMATNEQWQYLLDLEIWRKDRPQMEQLDLWLELLEEADMKRAVQYVLDDEPTLASYYLLKRVQVFVREEDEQDQPANSFTVDGVFYVRVLEPSKRERIERLLRAMAAEDFDRYQSLLLNLAGILPAEVEEEMYRLRNVRLSEHGFLPQEEAVSIYSPLELPPQDLSSLRAAAEQDSAEENQEIFPPVAPFSTVGEENMLKVAVSGVSDPLLLDRLRVEFAGLCNQILSAEGTIVDDLDVILEACRKGAGYLNVALERISEGNKAVARDTVFHGRLTDLFRMGFGMVLKLKWETRRWVKESWFFGKGLELSFWGDEWGGTLGGLLLPKPRLQLGDPEGAFKDFESVSEVERARRVLRHAQAVDRLLLDLERRSPFRGEILHRPGSTFYPLLLNLWGRGLLHLEPGVESLSLSEGKRLLEELRAGEKGPPYSMPGWEEDFVGAFLKESSDPDKERAVFLREALSKIWSLFTEEYARVRVSKLDPKYSRLLWIRSSGS